MSGTGMFIGTIGGFGVWRNFAQKLANLKTLSLAGRSFHCTCKNLTETTDNQPQQISAEQLIEQYEQKVDKSRLSQDELQIHRAHMQAIKENQHMYNDPVTGFEVFTILSHLERGYCCGNACRHCAYSYKNVDLKYKNLKKHNTAFYN